MRFPTTRNGRLGKFIPLQDRDKLARDMTPWLENRKTQPNRIAIAPVLISPAI